MSGYNSGNGYFLPGFLQQTVLDYFRTNNPQPPRRFPVFLKQAIPAVEIAPAAPAVPLAPVAPIAPVAPVAIARSPQRMSPPPTNRISAWQDDSSTMLGTENGGPNFVPYEVLLAKRSHWMKNEHLDHGLSDALGLDNGVKPLAPATTKFDCSDPLVKITCYNCCP